MENVARLDKKKIKQSKINQNFPTLEPFSAKQRKKRERKQPFEKARNKLNLLSLFLSTSRPYTTHTLRNLKPPPKKEKSKKKPRIDKRKGGGRKRRGQASHATSNSFTKNQVYHVHVAILR